MENCGFILQDYWICHHDQIRIHLSGNLTFILECGKGLLAYHAIATNIWPEVLEDNTRNPNEFFVRACIRLLVPLMSLL